MKRLCLSLLVAFLLTVAPAYAQGGFKATPGITSLNSAIDRYGEKYAVRTFDALYPYSGETEVRKMDAIHRSRFEPVGDFLTPDGKLLVP